MKTVSEQSHHPKVFIIYSHKDEEIKDQLLTHLSVGKLKDVIDVWTDSQIPAGTDWREEINKTLKETSLAILLVSADFLSSNAVRREISSLVNRREETGLPILPIIARPCLWSSEDWLRSLQVLPHDGRPLASMEKEERDEALTEIATQVMSLWEATVSRTEEIKKVESEKRPSIPAVSKPQIFISHCHMDGDFAEVLKTRLEQRGYSAWVDVDRLLPGQDWQEKIDKAIENSKALIAVMSPEARQSEYVTYEWAYAWGCGTKVMPVMVRQTSMHPRLTTIQYLDFTNRAARPWDKLFQALDNT